VTESLFLQISGAKIGSSGTFFFLPNVYGIHATLLRRNRFFRCGYFFNYFFANELIKAANNAQVNKDKYDSRKNLFLIIRPPTSM
jgi:hypothetical protein